MTAPTIIPAPRLTADGKFIVGAGLDYDDLTTVTNFSTAMAPTDGLIYILETFIGVNDVNGNPAWYTQVVYGALPYDAPFAGKQAQAILDLLAQKGI